MTQLKFSWKWCIILGVMLLLYREGNSFYRDATFKLQSQSPDGLRSVKGLHFKGVNRHPLDGDLRLYMNGNVFQTTIPWDRELRIVWDPANTSTFTLFSGDKMLMVWSLQTATPECTAGSEYLTYDPHELWARTGHPTP